VSSELAFVSHVGNCNECRQLMQYCKDCGGYRMAVSDWVGVDDVDEF
jgi:hypothetical protein